MKRLQTICLVLAILTLVEGPPLAYAQEKPASPPRPLYPIPRYDEDWTFLKDRSKRSDFWDPIKFIPFSEDSIVFLSFGGEMRETYERFRHTNFGLSPENSDGYLLQRYLFHGDFHMGSRFRFFGELSSSLEDGRAGGPRPVVDEDKLDVHQGFLDMLVRRARDDSSLMVRFGRQEINFGSGRLVALREGANVPLSFDGVRVALQRRPWRIDGFATRPVQSLPGIMNDPPQHDFAFWGVYATHPQHTGTYRPGLDFYYLGVDRERATYNQGAGRETRHTLGGRLWGLRNAWTYDTEAIYQFGSFASGTINAWRFAADTAYTLRSVRWHPRLGFAADAASGDRNPADPDLQTFYALFQSGTYSGRAQILGPANTIRLEPSLGLTFSERVTFSAGWGFYSRQSPNDGLYGIAGNLLVPSNGINDRYEGSRPIAQIDWQITRHLSAHVNGIYVFNARFEEQSVHGTKNMSYISPWVTYRF